MGDTPSAHLLRSYIRKLTTWLLMSLLVSPQLMAVNCTAVFQQIEVDYIIGRPNKDVHVTDLTDVPIIRMYGVTESGIRTCCEAMHQPH